VPEGLESLSMKDALEAARTEMSPASDVATDGAVPAPDVKVPVDPEQAPTPVTEQPAVDGDDGFSDEAQALAASLLGTQEDSQNESGPGITPGSDDFWNLSVDVKTVQGPQTVTIQELSDGYLRQADYTQKTQQLAEQRKGVSEASEFFDAFKDDPVGFARSLAVQAGWLEEGTEPVKQIDAAKIPTSEELETRISEMVDERVAADPRVKTAEVRDAEVQLDTEYDRLEKEYGLPLSKELRASLTDEAIKVGSSDLEGILTKRLVRSQQQQSKANSVNLASTSRPGAPPASVTTPEGAEVTEFPTMREAFAQAKVAAAQQ